MTLTLPRAPFLTLPQLLLAFLFKAVCVSTYASWHKYLSYLLATSTGCVPGKHRAATFTRRKKRGEKKLAEEEDWQAWREDWQKEKNRVNTDVCPSHPPFDWAESLSPYSYNSRRETRRPGCCITPVSLLLPVPPSPLICYSQIESQLLSYRVVFDCDFLWHYDTFEKSYQFTPRGLLTWKTLFSLFPWK